MRFKLKVIDGGLKGREGRSGTEIAVPVRRFFIGTAPDCHMRCSGHSISPHHCMILIEDDRVILRDDASEGGTFLNGQPIDVTACLYHGDRIRVGKLEFEVVMRSESRTPNLATPGKDPASELSSTLSAVPSAEQLEAEPHEVDPELAHRETVVDTDVTIAELMADMLTSEDDAERERRRFDPAAREYHVEAEKPREPTAEPTRETAAAKRRPPLQRPSDKLPTPPPIRGQNTVDAAEQALSHLLGPPPKKKPS